MLELRDKFDFTNRYYILPEGNVVYRIQHSRQNRDLYIDNRLIIKEDLRELVVVDDKILTTNSNPELSIFEYDGKELTEVKKIFDCDLVPSVINNSYVICVTQMSTADKKRQIYNCLEDFFLGKTNDNQRGIELVFNPTRVVGLYEKVLSVTSISEKSNDVIWSYEFTKEKIKKYLPDVYEDGRWLIDQLDPKSVEYIKGDEIWVSLKSNRYIILDLNSGQILRSLENPCSEYKAFWGHKRLFDDKVGVGMLNENIVIIDIHTKEVVQHNARNYNPNLKIDLTSKFVMDQYHYFIIDSSRSIVWAINRDSLKVEWSHEFESRPTSLKRSNDVLCVHCMNKTLFVFKNLDL